MNFNWCSTAIGVLHPSLAQPPERSQPPRPAMPWWPCARPRSAPTATRWPARRCSASLATTGTRPAYDGPDADQYCHLGRVPAGALAHLRARPRGGARCRPAPARRRPTSRAAAWPTTSSGCSKTASARCWTTCSSPCPPCSASAKSAASRAETAYLYWNMGNGMLLVTDEAQAAAVVQQLAQPAATQAQVAGYLTAEPGVTLRVAAGELRYA
ncbi:MAG: hypothetical protein WKG07_14440 [Hymenobacter sp.]